MPPLATLTTTMFVLELMGQYRKLRMVRHWMCMGTLYG